jgi:hypothetical protein
MNRVASRTPLRCRVARSVAVWRLDNGATLPAWTQRHQARCEMCRAQYERHRLLIEQLTTAAPEMRAEAPPFLRTRVLARLEGLSTARRFGPAWAGMVTAMVIAVSLVALLNQPNPSLPGDPERVALAPVSNAPDALDALLKMPKVEVVFDLGAKLDDPLETELSLMLSDTREVLVAISSQFLPADFLPTRP